MTSSPPLPISSPRVPFQPLDLGHVLPQSQRADDAHALLPCPAAHQISTRVRPLPLYILGSFNVLSFSFKASTHSLLLSLVPFCFNNFRNLKKKEKNGRRRFDPSAGIPIPSDGRGARDALPLPKMCRVADLCTDHRRRRFVQVRPVGSARSMLYLRLFLYHFLPDNLNLIFIFYL